MKENPEQHNLIMTTSGEILQEIGRTALRDPAGNFLPSVPMYVLVSPDAVNPETGMTKGEEDLLFDVAEVFADKMRQYVNNGGLIGKKAKEGKKKPK